MTSIRRGLIGLILLPLTVDALEIQMHLLRHLEIETAEMRRMKASPMFCCTSPSAAPVSWTPWCTCPEIVLDGQRTWVWTMKCLANASKMLLGQCARCGVIKHVCIATETQMKLISFWMKKPTRSTRESSWHCSGSQSNVCCLLGMMTPTSFGQTLLSLRAPRIARLKASCPWRNFRDTLAIGKQSSWWANSLPPHRPMSRWHWSAWGKALLSWVCKKSGRFPSACSTRNSEDPVEALNFWTPNPIIAEQTLQALMKRRFWMAGWMKWIVLSMQRPSKSSTADFEKFGVSHESCTACYEEAGLDLTL